MNLGFRRAPRHCDNRNECVKLYVYMLSGLGLSHDIDLTYRSRKVFVCVSGVRSSSPVSRDPQVRVRDNLFPIDMLLQTSALLRRTAHCSSSRIFPRLFLSFH